MRVVLKSPMKSLNLKAPAKINFYLNVLGKRKDNYHEIESIVQSIGVYDILRFEKIKKGISVVCSNFHLPGEKDNLVYKAAELFFDFTGLPPGIKITLQKKIPMGAGLGGGSTDAATTLLALNMLFDAKIPLPTLVNLSSQLGTDVPFCLIRGTALLRGKGEKVYSLPSIKEGWLVLVYPNIHVSTSWAYSQVRDRLTERKLNNKLSLKDLIKRIKSKQIQGVKELLYNKLEEVVIEKFPLIGEIKKEFKKRGIADVLMSGSGSTVFAVVESEKDAKRLASFMQGKGKVYLTQPTEEKVFQGGSG